MFYKNCVLKKLGGENKLQNFLLGVIFCNNPAEDGVTYKNKMAINIVNELRIGMVGLTKLEENS